MPDNAPYEPFRLSAPNNAPGRPGFLPTPRLLPLGYLRMPSPSISFLYRLGSFPFR